MVINKDAEFKRLCNDSGIEADEAIARSDGTRCWLRVRSGINNFCYSVAAPELNDLVFAGAIKLAKKRRA